jgi:hypothetical protein
LEDLRQKLNGRISSGLLWKDDALHNPTKGKMISGLSDNFCQYPNSPSQYHSGSQCVSISSWSFCSLGEQQRVAFARLLLHRPGLAFLDEATGALDSETEAVLYRALQRQSQSFVSIGKRRRLGMYGCKKRERSQTIVQRAEVAILGDSRRQDYSNAFLSVHLILKPKISSQSPPPPDSCNPL